MLFAAGLLLLQTVPAPAAQCAAIDAALPPALRGWASPGEQFVPGSPVVLGTGDAAELKGLPAGSKPGKAVMIGFRVTEPGIYGIALDQPGWIDVLPGFDGGDALTSVKHGHGPACSTVRKIVRFDLQPGVYRIYVSGLDAPQVKVMLVTGA